MTVPVPADLDLQRLLSMAEGVLDSVQDVFIDGLGAPSAVSKIGDDFATHVDLSLERRIGAELQELTGIEVHGEEFGGPPSEAGTVWILDPIDGTYNYSVGLPMAAMLLSLAIEGEPVIGVTRLPILNQSYAAVVGESFTVNGEPGTPLVDSALSSAVIGCGSYNARGGGRYSGAARAELYRMLSYRARRMRMTGSTGADLAYVAAGIFGGAVSFSRHAWDNAAGVALIRAAGGIATDVHGHPWRVGSRSMVAGDKRLHEELLTVVAQSGVPDRRTNESKVEQ
ncbi:myo-inositol-1(or 4)-monophosphatase [Gordonia malaquae]|uniref:inositol-phosphate phosphatase n=1 Tax=Gordonia malaquae NBRC 108250 TaxID=1223542 RepID=M3UTB8_GORML|nr:inositol monophosphatase [Gordonia malaquae]GAC78577.1 inositol monophosphatase ImpA [Gordonia malaquae NBRC 108250]SED53738.1 myo-inositol-1(or 4)-monophosphatase [Gordonia malaquae]